MKQDALDRYRGMRDFAASPEPRGGVGRRRAKGLRYFIQKHAARALHYDFRLELDGVLKSWAVPKGPGLAPGDKRLAVEVEDHPLDYGRFEGVIPEGQYGAGTVEVWDEGTWTPEGDPHEGLRKGRLTFRLDGRRLKGVWSLIRIRPDPKRKKNNWLLIRSRRDRVPVVEEGPPARPSKRPEFLEPELATLVDEAPAGDGWIHELKFDGYRLIACVRGRSVTLYTRTGLDWTGRFEALARSLGRLGLKDAVLDGELVALDEKGVSRFASLQKALSEGRADSLVFQVFDLLRSDGADLRGRALLDRKQALAALLGRRKSPGMIRYTEHVRGSGDSVQQEACRLGAEGIVSKKADSPYLAGRGTDWVKVKCVLEQEFVIGGYTDPKGSREALGALLLGYHDRSGLVYAGRVGTGFDAPLLRDLKSKLERLDRADSPFHERLAYRERKGVHWVEPSLVAQIRYTGWTEDRRLRHPTFQGLREDKPAREVEREAGRSALAPGSKPKAAGVLITHPERMIYPEQRLTKLAVARYYERVADRMLPHLENRPLALLRCPDGRGGACFYQKNWTKSGDAVRTLRIAGKTGSADAPVIRDAAGLLTLIQHGALEIHPWGSRTPTIENPDVCVFDLDPGPGVPWPDLAAAARALRDRLHSRELESFLKTTGGKGLHVVVPLQGRVTWDGLRDFARETASSMAHDHADLYTATMSKKARGGRIFIDWLRNGRGSTAVAPWSTRARANAPVAAPLSWDELEKIDRADSFTLTTIDARLEGAPDPWKGYFQVRQRLPRR